MIHEHAARARSGLCPRIGLIGLFAIVGCGGDSSLKVQPQSVYRPYPSGIVPADLDAEVARVLSETRVIYERTISEWQTLPGVTFLGNPPTIAGDGCDAVRVLGTLVNFDQNVSVGKNRACSSCHMPYAGFGGPIPSVNLTMIAHPGSAGMRAGKRSAQRYTYGSTGSDGVTSAVARFTTPAPGQRSVTRAAPLPREVDQERQTAQVASIAATPPRPSVVRTPRRAPRCLRRPPDRPTRAARRSSRAPARPAAP